MTNFCTKFTDDGSVGLYSDEVGDIYHSKYGALSEAYEKFIFPAKFDKFLKTHNEIKILDLCYGIGYNSKAFLNFYFNILDFKNEICTNNIKNINSIYTDNILSKKNYKIILHGVEFDENLIKLSPFIKQSKIYSNKNNLFSHVNRNQFNKYFISDTINIFLFLKIFETYSGNYFDNDIIQILSFKANKKFFTQNLAFLIKKYHLHGYKLSLNEQLLALLHNIYYKYISNSYKNALKMVKNNKIDLQLYNEDARSFIQKSDFVYDFIFLDAFSPDKAPSLWTVEFINNLYNHLSDDGLILTYSNSACVRNAFLENNFYVGKIYNKYEKRFTGTVASKNKNLIEYNLDEYELGLLKTKAGICYHDNTYLSLDDTEIINNRKIVFDNSDLISATKYKKENKCHTM